MTGWETDDDGTTVHSLAGSGDAPNRTLSRGSRASRRSNRSRRSATPPGHPGKRSPSIPALPTTERLDRTSKRSSRDIPIDDGLSLLDPRRFTPTLHASLVSEILALRRDQEDKIKTIERLEETLHATKEEAEAAQASCQATSKESQSLKRQLALLEGGTSSALGELARERDEAVETISDAKKRLEAAQKRLRMQEEQSQRVLDQWARDKHAWEDEKRKMERKVHVAENRLRVVLDEVTAMEAAQAEAGAKTQPDADSDGAESTKESDAASVRTMSMSPRKRMSAPLSRPLEKSLADELTDGDFDESDTENGGRESALSNHYRHVRNLSRDSLRSKRSFPLRTTSSENLMRPTSGARGRMGLNSSTLDRLEGGVIREDDETQAAAAEDRYDETGVQHSLPPSPVFSPPEPAFPDPEPLPPPRFLAARLQRAHEVEVPVRVNFEIEANQRRKRAHMSHPALTIQTLRKRPSQTGLMVNGSSQTMEEPLSPPKTPKTPGVWLQPGVQPYETEEDSLPIPPPPTRKAPTIMLAASTQTDLAPFAHSPNLRPFIMSPIPSIRLIPPSSRPSTPCEPLLPQLTKNFGCQVAMVGPVPYTSMAVQTEEIRIDQRLNQLPRHLHPSAISSRPNSTHIEQAVDDNMAGQVPPARNPQRLATRTSLNELTTPSSSLERAQHEARLQDAYPGSNDDGPLSSQDAPMRRPHRFSSLFAGFADANSSDDSVDGASDREYQTALSPRPRDNAPHGGGQPFAFRGDSRRAVGRVCHSPGPHKTVVMRKAAMIQSGIASHQLATSPTACEAADPPFPIPTRASSRKPPSSASAPSDGCGTPSRESGAWPNRSGSSQDRYGASSLREARSAAVLPRHHKVRRRESSRSPPCLTPTSGALGSPLSPGLSLLANSVSTTPLRTREDQYQGRQRAYHQKLSSMTTENTAETYGSGRGSTGQQSTVVDSIAQAMVGEWMFKYVRRRKSFGVGDSRSDDTSNDRHRRWVWLAPYERSILWSSKQPSTGSALLGMSGRKLSIQSVLDVKDDNPAPRNAGPVFNRSILILTPQRALKFTAVSAERHYLWLTSLCFLAHSQQAMPELLPVVQTAKPPAPTAGPPQIPRRRRPGIRDSIRLTKSKTSSLRTAVTSSSQATSADSAPPVPLCLNGYLPANIPEDDEAYQVPAHPRVSRDAAEPPFVPRFTDCSSLGKEGVRLHGRKRSNTGPPLSFRGLSYTAPSSTAESSDVTWAAGTSSMRTSEASSRPPKAILFDTIGTVRMEAFISPMAFSQAEEVRHENLEYRRVVRRRSKDWRKRRSRGQQRESFHTGAQYREGRRTCHRRTGTRGTDEHEEWYEKEDPFKGF